MSLSARRAWIEIGINPDQSGKTDVALRKESVDRNSLRMKIPLAFRVALRKESVDRNRMICSTRKELAESLSARRAWIEILAVLVLVFRLYVALRKESVDRNFLAFGPILRALPSLSARRAWIEINIPPDSVLIIDVALRKESVDRNE